MQKKLIETTVQAQQKRQINATSTTVSCKPISEIFFLEILFAYITKDLD